MPNISRHKMMSHIDRIMGDHRPITADIFLTNFCNNRCPYCTYSRWGHEPDARYMSFADFKRYAERMIDLGVQGFILTGGGEPTLNPDFDEIANWLTENGLHWGINTNFNNLKYIKPDYLKVSLDGYDEDSYERSRGVRKYAQVRENIKTYAEWRKGNSPKTSLGIQMVATRAEDVYKFCGTNADLDVDYIVLRPVESTGGKYYKDIKHIAATADADGLGRVLDAIEDVRDYDKRVVRNFKWDMLDRQEPSCLAQWAQIAVNELGEVMYCCHKPYQTVGHIMDEDILEKKEKAGTDMKMCDIPCRMTAPNMFVSQLHQNRKDDCFI